MGLKSFDSFYSVVLWAFYTSHLRKQQQPLKKKKHFSFSRLVRLEQPWSTQHISIFFFSLTDPQQPALHLSRVTSRENQLLDDELVPSHPPCHCCCPPASHSNRWGEHRAHPFVSQTSSICLQIREESGGGWKGWVGNSDPDAPPCLRRASLSGLVSSSTIYIFQTDFSCKLHASTLTIDEGQDNKLQANTRSISSEKTLHFVEYEAGIYLSVRRAESDQGLNTNLRLLPPGGQRTSSPPPLVCTHEHFLKSWDQIGMWPSEDFFFCPCWMVGGANSLQYKSNTLCFAVSIALALALPPRFWEKQCSLKMGGGGKTKIKQLTLL